MSSRLIHEDSGRPRQRALLSCLIGLTSFGLISWVSTAISVRNQQQLELRLGDRGRQLSDRLQRELESAVTALQRLSERWEFAATQEGFEPDHIRQAWNRDSQAYIDDFGYFQAIEWADESGIVRWIQPVVGNEAALNLDLSQEPRRAATLRTAQQSDQPIATRSVQLVQGGHGLLIVIPIQTPNQLFGYTVAVFRANPLFDSITRERQDFLFEVWDGEDLVYRSDADEPRSVAQEPAGRVGTSRFPLQSLGDPWALVVRPQPSLITEQASPLPEFVLLAGTILSVTLAVLVYVWRTSTSRSEALTRSEGEQRKAVRVLESLNAELTKRNQELDEFAYIASHDLKTPLRGIDHLAQFVQEDLGDGIPDETKKHLLLMQQRIRQMESLMNDLLAYSRAQRSDGSETAVDLNAQIREICEMIDPPEGIEIRADDTLPIVSTELPPLRLVLLNLITNAVRHHDRSHGWIQVSANIASEGKHLEIIVRDDGPGIAPRHHERVFKMFQTLQPRREGGGSGMGLALVRKTVESRGGTIHLESPGDTRGCVFRVTWPLSETREPVSALPEAHPWG